MHRRYSSMNEKKGYVEVIKIVIVAQIIFGIIRRLTTNIRLIEGIPGSIFHTALFMLVILAYIRSSLGKQGLGKDLSIEDAVELIYRDVIAERYPNRFMTTTSGSRIDYVYLSPALNSKVTDAAIVCDAWVKSDLPVSPYVDSFRTPSDHRPILVNIRVK